MCSIRRAPSAPRLSMRAMEQIRQHLWSLTLRLEEERGFRWNDQRYSKNRMASI
jgi:hypothetical protein